MSTHMNTGKGLKVLLIDASFSTTGSAESQGDLLTNTSIPLSVGYIGSYIKSNLPDIDLTILKASYEIESFIKNEKPDVLGICNYLWNTNLSVSLSNYSRKINTLFIQKNLSQQTTLLKNI